MKYINARPSILDRNQYMVANRLVSLQPRLSGSSRGIARNRRFANHASSRNELTTSGKRLSATHSRYCCCGLQPSPDVIEMRRSGAEKQISRRLAAVASKSRPALNGSRLGSGAGANISSLATSAEMSASGHRLLVKKIMLLHDKWPMKCRHSVLNARGRQALKSRSCMLKLASSCWWPKASIAVEADGGPSSASSVAMALSWHSIVSISLAAAGKQAI